jgi:hypothetical protein
MQMARKESAAAILAERNTLRTREHILSIAYLETADATYRHRVGRDVYTWKAYRLDGAEGGLVVCYFDGFSNRKPSMFYVERLDTAAQQVREHGWAVLSESGMCDAVQQFTTKRGELTRAA